MQCKSQIRSQLIQLRQQLSSSERLAKSSQIWQRLSQQACWQEAQHVACYITYKAEVATQLIMQKLWQQAKFCYLPVINAAAEDFSMRFALHQPLDKLEKNRFGIQQPSATNNFISTQDLDIVLVPLVAFDCAGNRLGMGAGFYDRAFTGKRQNHKPILIGLAYDLQQVDELPTAAWDVALDMIVTETRLVQFKR